MIAKQIFKFFSEKNAYLICPDTPTFHEHNDVHKKRFTSHLKKFQHIPPFWEGKKHRSQLRALLPNHSNSNMPVNLWKNSLVFW